MDTLLITVVGILLIVAAIFLIFAVLMQSAKNSRMSGVVSGGGAETFFGKYKGKTVDKKLNRWTIIIASVFVVVVILLFMIQPGVGSVKDNPNDADWDQAAQDAATTTVVTTTTPKPSATTASGAATTVGSTTVATSATTAQPGVTTAATTANN